MQSDVYNGHNSDSKRLPAHPTFLLQAAKELSEGVTLRRAGVR